MESVQFIFCCGCEKTVKAEVKYSDQIFKVVTTKKIKRYLVCETCGSYVIAPQKDSRPSHIPSKELAFIQREIHNTIDPLWKKGLIPRGEIYSILNAELGYIYHTSELCTLKQAVKALIVARRISTRLHKGLTNDIH